MSCSGSTRALTREVDGRVEGEEDGEVEGDDDGVVGGVPVPPQTVPLTVNVVGAALVPL